MPQTPSPHSRWLAAVALWAAAGLIGMHGLITAAPESPHSDHGDHTATAGTIGLCVFILATGLAAAAAPPSSRHLPRFAAVTRLGCRAASITERRNSRTWCVLRA